MDKRAERVATAYRNDIERASWPVGVVLGSETELIERYDVSRAILREAVRILEYHGAVRTKRGPLGGLIVTAPDSGRSCVRPAPARVRPAHSPAALRGSGRRSRGGSAARCVALRPLSSQPRCKTR